MRRSSPLVMTVLVVVLVKISRPPLSMVALIA